MATYAGHYDEILLRKAGSRLAPAAAETTVLVYEDDGTTVATLYTDRTKSTEADNPIDIDDAGNLEFFAEPGTYIIAIREGGVQVATDTVAVPYDPVEGAEATVAAEAAATEAAVAQAAAEAAETAATAAQVDAAASATIVTGYDARVTDVETWQGIAGDAATVGGLAARVAVIEGRVFDVTEATYGATGDGATDDTAAIQAALNAASLADGGLVYFPPGTYVTTGVTVSSHVTILGAGPKATTLQMAAATNGDVIATEDFATLTGSNTWLASAGVPLGFAIRDLRIDGNKANQTTGGYGLRLYGKRYLIDNVIVHDCFDDGFYSECAAGGGQTETDDMPEAHIARLWSRNNGGNGVTFYGPHDARIDTLYVMLNAGDGLVVAADGATYNGRCDIGFVHAYGNVGTGVNLQTSATFEFIQTESNNSAGLICTAENTIGGTIYAFKNWEGASPTHADASVLIQASRSTFACVKVRTDYGGTGVEMSTGINNVIGALHIDGEASAGRGLYINSNGHQIRQAVIEAFSAAGGIGLETGTPQNVAMAAHLSGCETLVSWGGASSNSRYDLSGFVSAGQTTETGTISNAELRRRFGGAGTITSTANEHRGAWKHTGNTLGFFNSTPITKPDISGSRGGNAALQDLLFSLDALGLITDSTTA